MARERRWPSAQPAAQPSALASVLVLGGTGEARRLAGALARPGLRVVSALAGRTSEPLRPEGELRIGGFGGPDGLAEWLRAERIDLVIDATHPFAARITETAVTVCAALDLPLLVLRRPGWSPEPGDDWRSVPSLEAAAAALPGLGERVFLSVGRQGIAAFHGLDLFFLARCVEPPEPPVPGRLEVVLDRGPYTVDGELDLLRRNDIDLLVSRDSGGGQTAAKLVAARTLGLPVVLVTRPALPAGVPVVATVDEAVSWVGRGR